MNPVDHRVKLKESEKRDKYLDLARELKRLSSMKVMVIRIQIGMFATGTGRHGNKRMSGGHPNYSIVEMSQNS